MDSCPLLLELCEAILDALLIDLILAPGLAPSSVYIGQHYEDIQAQQDTLCACALVCRAWRPRSRYLLFKRPLFRSGGATAQANDTIFRDKASRPWSREWAVTAIHFQGELDSESRREPGKAAHAGSRLRATQLLKNTNFFMRSFPNLSLFLHVMRWVAHPHLVPLRLAFFTTLTHLAVDGCRFDSIRDMLDPLWVCSSLTHVRIAVCSFRHLRYCDDIHEFTDPDQLCLALERLGACKHLTFLHIENEEGNVSRRLLDIIDLFPFLDLPGRVFGDAVTTLWLSISSQPRLDPPYSGSMGTFERFLRGSFPDLLELDVRVPLTRIDPTSGTPYLYLPPPYTSLSSLVESLDRAVRLQRCTIYCAPSRDVFGLSCNPQPWGSVSEHDPPERLLGSGEDPARPIRARLPCLSYLAMHLPEGIMDPYEFRDYISEKYASLVKAGISIRLVVLSRERVVAMPGG